MCISPVLIPNPNYRARGGFSFMKDTVCRFIKVPCGHCSECVCTRQLGIVQRCQMESVSGWPFFVTLTYNETSLPFLITSDWKRIRYADISDVVNMFKRLRKSNVLGRRFRYLAVSELGAKRARPHFHLLVFLERLPDDSVYTPINLERVLFDSILHEWRRNYGSRRNPEYRPLCTYITKYVCGKLKSTYDCHYVSPSPLDGSSLDVPFYVTKYMLKPCDRASRLQRALRLNLPEDEYERIWSKVKPRWFSSLNFGFGVYDDLNPRKTSFQDRMQALSSTDAFRHVRASIDRSLVSSDRPKFYDLDRGRSLPLSRYYKSFGSLYTIDDALTFFYNDSNARADNVVIDDRSMTEKLLQEQSHIRRLRQIDEHSDNQNLLFE